MTFQWTLSRYLGALGCLIILAGFPAVAADELPVPDELAGDPEAEGFADLLFANGMLLLNDGKHGEALELFERAAGAVPGNATYAYFVGHCQLQLERYTEAVLALTRALPPARGRVREAAIRSDLGQAHARAGDADAAIEELRRSIRLDDEYAQAHLWLGLVLSEKGDAQGAVHLERAAQLDSRLAGVASYYDGVRAHGRGDAAAARTAFEKASRSRYAVGVADSGQLWLAALDDGPRRTPVFEARVALLGEYDSSPAALPEEGGFDGDNRAVLEFRLVGQYQPRKGPWAGGGFVNGYGSAHGDVTLFDQRAIQGGLQAVWGGDDDGYLNGTLGYMQVPSLRRRVSVLFQAASTHVSLDGESFRRDHEAALNVFLHQFGFGKTQFELTYTDVNFFQRDSVPGDPNLFFSGHNTLFRVGQYFNLGKRKGRYLRAAIGRTAHTTQAKFAERDTYEALLELALPFASRWNLILNGGYLGETWDDSSIAALGPGPGIPLSAPREERQVWAGVSLAVAIIRHSFITARYFWYDREIEPPDWELQPGVPWSYDRSIASVGIHFIW